MMDRRRLLALGLVVGFAAACGGEDVETEAETVVDDAAPAAEQPAAWSYEGETGPEEWGDLSADYAACETGQAQSPIDLPPVQTAAGDLPALDMGYQAAELTLEDTGHGYKASPDTEQTLTIGDDSYRLLQFHAHTPSEHTVDGQSYPMEVHFVHQNDAGELAVVGVLIEEGGEHGAYTDMVSAIVDGAETVTVEDVSSLLPSERDYYTYSGSLTTPPCTEGVRWIVLETPISLSSEQLATFQEAHGETNRPILPLYDREVQYSGE